MKRLAQLLERRGPRFFRSFGLCLDITKLSLSRESMLTFCHLRGLRCLRSICQFRENRHYFACDRRFSLHNARSQVGGGLCCSDFGIKFTGSLVFTCLRSSSLLLRFFSGSFGLFKFCEERQLGFSSGVLVIL